MMFLITTQPFLFSQKSNRIHKKANKNLRIATNVKLSDKRKDVAFDKAKALYQKALLADSTKKQDSIFQSDLKTLRNLCVRKSLQLHDSAKITPGFRLYEKAAQLLEEALYFNNLLINEHDTTFKIGKIHYFTGSLYQKGRIYSKAIQYFELCIAKNYFTIHPYISLSKTYQQLGETGSEISILEKGYLKYPESDEMLTTIINYHMAAEDYEEALDYLDKAIQKNDLNVNYYFAKAAMLNSMCNKENITLKEKERLEKMSLKYYNKVLKLDPSHSNALYNMGTVFYNRAVKTIMEADKIPIRENDRYEEEIAKSKIEFQEALPYFEKAFFLNNKDQYALQALKIIYLKLGYKEQIDIVNRIIDGEKIAFTPISNIELLKLEKQKRLSK